MNLSCDCAVGTVRRDEGSYSDARRVREQFRDLGHRYLRTRNMHRTDSCSTYLSDPPDVLVARLLIEPKILVQSETHVIAVEAVRELVQV